MKAAAYIKVALEAPDRVVGPAGSPLGSLYALVCSSGAKSSGSARVEKLGSPAPQLPSHLLLDLLPFTQTHRTSSTAREKHIMQQSSTSSASRGIPQFNLRFVRGVAQGDPADPQARSNHRQDLERISSDLASWRVDLKNLARTNVVFALIVYLLRSLRNFVWTLVFSPATVFLDPVGTFAGLIITPVVAVGVALCCVVFWVGGKIGLDKVIDWASDKWADGYSMPNWVSLSVLLDDDEGPVLRKLGAVRPALSAAESRLVRYGKHHRASGGSPDPPGRWCVHSTIHCKALDVRD